MRVHEVAVLVHRADAVGVAVVDEAGVKAQLGNLRDAAVDPGRNGLGVQTVERRVLGVVDLAYFHAQVAQQLRQIDAAGAVQRVHHHAQVGVADGLDVHALLQGGEVRGHEVDRFERTTRSVNSLPAAPPSLMRSFTPRYSAGLWLLVSMMPPTASAFCATDQHSVGVGQ